MKSKFGRRDFIRLAATAAAGGAGWAAIRANNAAFAWQLDPLKCVQCGRCATECVLNPSAVKCVHSYQVCGYCDLCSGYLIQGAKVRDTGASSELCPVGALERKFVEQPFYQYTVNETLCVGCGKCVKGCGAFGNGSLYLQCKQDLCAGCNECAIARNCPSGAWQKVPLSKAYLLKTDKLDAGIDSESASAVVGRLRRSRPSPGIATALLVPSLTINTSETSPLPSSGSDIHQSAGRCGPTSAKSAYCEREGGGEGAE